MNVKRVITEDIEIIETIESHTAGEPLRVIVKGLPNIEGDTILEKRSFVKENFDEIRRGLMLEPRGHPDMYGAIITEPTTPDGDIGVIFIHNDGYSTMCGHGIIALTKVILDKRIIDKEGDNPEINYDTPAGRVKASAKIEDGKVVEVSFLNVPSFVYKDSLSIWTSEFGKIDFDIAFGGAFYAYLPVDQIELKINQKNHDKFVKIGRKIKKMISKKYEIKHPYEDDLGFLYGTIFIGPPSDPSNHSRNVCVFADGEVDRSPTGTGVSGRAAIHYSRGEIHKGEMITIESILGTTFDVEVVKTTKFRNFEAIIPKVTGGAYITGQSKYYFDPDDPLKHGFMLR
ncbi:MAG: proline racemase family protein [Thermoplasmatota archaeon]